MRRSPSATLRFLVAPAVLLLGACSVSSTTASQPGTTSPVSTTSTTSTVPTTSLPDPAATPSTATTVVAGSIDARQVLAPLVIDDGPRPSGYRRDEWPHWKDIDGDGCDARDKALAAASTSVVRRAGHCRVVNGTWTSAYDGFTTTDPGKLDVDHVVPLANAFRSGGATWSTDQRARYANDQADLWVVSASANRAKGDRGPEEWRPPATGSWCTYAQRWVAIKVRWQLTATTDERDALGQMLDTCPGAG